MIEDRSYLTHLDCVRDKDERRHSDPSLLFLLSIPLFFLFLSQRELVNVLESSKKKERKRESWRKKEKMRARFAGMFLNEGENENKRRVGGIVIGH